MPKLQFDTVNKSLESRYLEKLLRDEPVDFFE